MSEAEHARVIGRVIEERREQAGALLPILHGIQDALGHVPPQ
jgi:formate dehydrogenase subunit gamma